MQHYNIHTHIFNLKNVPNKAFGVPIARLLSSRAFSWNLAKILKKIPPYSRTDFLERYANMLMVGSKKTQELIFKQLYSYYDQYQMKIIALTLDMDHMVAGDMRDNYLTQLSQVEDLTLKYHDKLLPFLSIDPRRNYPDVKAFLKKKFNNWNYVGIKLYPPLGFYPFDPRLEPVYEFAVENNLPIMVHCTKYGVFYQSKKRPFEHYHPRSMNPEYQHDYSHMKKAKKSEFKNNFTNPKNFVEVLEIEKFKNLKVCFAHFGGAEELLRSKGEDTNPETNFYLKIKELIQDDRFPNIYTDISYTVHHIGRKDVREIMLKDINDPTLRDNIMYGSDFYMTTRKKGEDKLLQDFIFYVNREDFDRLAGINCENYLSSNYYPA
jgi:predicted TIM-barrel fold metal-dependent hydrolase